MDDRSDIKQLHARNQDHVKQIFGGLHPQRQQHGANPQEDTGKCEFPRNNGKKISREALPDRSCARDPFPAKKHSHFKKLISDESFIIALIFDNASLLLDYLISTQNVTIFYRGK